MHKITKISIFLSLFTVFSVGCVFATAEYPIDKIYSPPPIQEKIYDRDCIEDIGTPPELAAPIALFNRELSGEVLDVEIPSERSRWVCVSLKLDTDELVEVKLHKDTQVLNAESGRTCSADRITQGQYLYVSFISYYEDTVPNSIIAKTVAVATAKRDISPFPHFYTLDTIQTFNEKGIDYVKIQTNKGMTITTKMDDLISGWKLEYIDINEITSGAKLMALHSNTSENEVFCIKITLIDYGSTIDKVEVRNNPVSKDFNQLICSYTVNSQKFETKVGYIEKIETEDYVPLRKIIEALGPNYGVNWSREEGVTVNVSNTKYYLTNGKNTVRANGLTINTNDELCVIIRDGTTYVPWSFLTDIFGITTVGFPGGNYTIVAGESFPADSSQLPD